jgi:hypothetical protein
VDRLIAALKPDDVVLGGGNAKKLKPLPSGTRLGDNAFAYPGGFRLWEREPDRPQSFTTGPGNLPRSLPSPPSDGEEHRLRGDSGPKSKRTK